MKHLLDVNALLACEHQGSPHHANFHAWAHRVGLENLFTCGLVEVGFIRVSMQVFGYELPQAQTALRSIKQRLGGFIDVSPPPQLPAWASSPAKTSDAYLAQLATTHGVTLATFDRGIPGSLRIQ